MNVLLYEKTDTSCEAALVEDGSLVEFFPFPDSALPAVGQVYLGRCARVMKSLQAVFVRLDGKYEGFLPFQEAAGAQPKTGDVLMVQVKKAPSRGKAAYLTCDIALPGRYAMLLPRGSGVHVSARIEDQSQRAAVKAMGRQLAPDGMGLVMRSASLEADEAAVRKEVYTLAGCWQALASKAKRSSAPCLLSEPEHPINALLRELDGRVDRVLTNDSSLQVDGDIPCAFSEYPFLLYRVRESLHKAMRRKVYMKNGGTLIIDPCEAMTVIDVNTASHTAGRSAERTVMDINREAVREAARLLRLRRTGGIVIIDLIDMPDEESRSMVLDELKDALKHDRVKTTVHGFTSLGLLEMTRRRTGESLAAERLALCPACGGSSIAPYDMGGAADAG